jgi:hypothetical protein
MRNEHTLLIKSEVLYRNINILISCVYRNIIISMKMSVIETPCRNNGEETVCCQNHELKQYDSKWTSSRIYTYTYIYIYIHIHTR